jgi:hypothetical protein
VYKQLINIFLVLVLATQMLPVEQMGKLLFSNQITEELPHSADTEVVKKASTSNEFLAPNAEGLFAKLGFVFSSATSDSKVNFPHNHSKDIHNPPPNCHT